MMRFWRLTSADSPHQISCLVSCSNVEDGASVMARNKALESMLKEKEKVGQKVQVNE
jgi:hypothetical protein